MNHLFKKNDPARKYYSFKTHTEFLLKPFVISFVITSFWYLAYCNDIHFDKQDEGALIGAAIMTLAVAYSITMTLIFATIWERYQKVVMCIFKKDRTTFLYYRDERIPVVVYLLIAVLSIPLLIMIGGLEYHNVNAGIASVFSVSFVLSLYWSVIAQLECPTNSIWLAQRIPSEWLEVDVDEEFFIDKGRYKY